MNLVTGATGHIGNTLVRALRARELPVRAMILPNEDRTPLENLDVEVVEGNVLHPQELRQAMQSVDTVYHLAAMVSILPGQNEMMRRVNVEGTRNVIAAAQAAGVRRLVYTSSIHAILRAPHGTPIDESLPFDPQNPAGEYDRTKAQASLAVLQAAQVGLDAVIVCPTGVVGPGDYRWSEMGHLIFSWMKRGLHVIVDGHFDFVDVRDVAEGHILAAQHGLRGQTYILGGENITLDSMLRIVQEAAGIRSPRVKIPFSLAMAAAQVTPWYYRLTHTRPRFTPYSLETVQSNSEINSQRARRELGFAPRSLRDSLADTVQWWRQNAARLRSLAALGRM